MWLPIYRETIVSEGDSERQGQTQVKAKCPVESHWSVPEDAEERFAPKLSSRKGRWGEGPDSRLWKAINLELRNRAVGQRLSNLQSTWEPGAMLLPVVICPLPQHLLSPEGLGAGPTKLILEKSQKTNLSPYLIWVCKGTIVSPRLHPSLQRP